MSRRQANPSGTVTSRPGRCAATLGQKRFKDVDGFEEKYDLVLRTVSRRFFRLRLTAGRCVLHLIEAVIVHFAMSRCRCF